MCAALKTRTLVAHPTERLPVISTFIVDNYALTRIALGVALVVAIVVALNLVRQGRIGRRIATGLAIAGGVAILALTLAPDARSVDGVMACNFTVYSIAGDTFNMALFLLPAIFVVVATRRPLIVAAAVPLLSALIELVQFLSPVLGRRCDVDDLIANVVGGLIGVAIGALVLRLRLPIRA